MLSPRFGWSLGLLLILFLHLPFLHQAFHIDDQSFLAIAQQIIQHPLDPYGFSLNLDGVSRPALESFGNPPLHCYLLAAVIQVGGLREWPLHLLSFVFIALLFFGMASLGRRYGVPPVPAALLAMFTPAVWVMGHTCMPDVGVLALGVLAVVSLIRACDRNDHRWAMLAGLLAGLASLMKYSGLLMVPILATYALLFRRWRVGVTAVCAALIPFALWDLGSRWLYGVSHFGIHSQTIQGTAARSLQDLAIQMASVLLYVGAATLFPVSLLLTWKERGVWGTACLGVFLISAALFALTARWAWDYSPVSTLWMGIALSAGITGLYTLVFRPLSARLQDLTGPPKAREEFALLLWFFIAFVSVPFQYFPAVRRILLLIPPWVLLFLRRIQPDDSRRGRLLLGCALLGTLGMGGMVSWADYEQAEVYRRFALNVAPAYRSHSGRNWFAGHWGFQRYMEQSGFRPLDVHRDHPGTGDRVVIASQPWPQILLPPLTGGMRWPPGFHARIRPHLTVVTPALPALPIRTISQVAMSNFYSNVNSPGTVALLPYTFSRAPLEVFVIWEVEDPRQGEHGA